MGFILPMMYKNNNKLGKLARNQIYGNLSTNQQFLKKQFLKKQCFLQRLALSTTTASSSNYGIETLLLHGGQTPDPATGSRAVPLYQSTSFQFHNSQHAAELFALEEAGNIYTRLSNPTSDVFEKRMALLEEGVGALATSSGQAAVMTTILTIMGAGNEIVAASTLYGGTHHLFSDTLPKIGIKTTFVQDINKIETVRAAINEKTRAIFAETIGNPKLNILDLEPLAKLANEFKIPLIVDSTFATPYLCNPLLHGADIVIHSATKWIGGHGTSIGGCIIDGGKFNWNNPKFPDFTTPDPGYNNLTYAGDFGTLAFIVKARVQVMRDLGPCISPFNSWCLLNGLETLHLRMKQHCINAKQVAQFLLQHPNVAWVHYPGLPTHETHHLAKKYLRKNHGGSMVVFGIKGTRENGMKFIENLSLWSHLANVGDAKSLVIHPASTTHQQLSPEALAAGGIGEDLIRLSVGLENVDDLIHDLDHALQNATQIGEIPKGKRIIINDENTIRQVCATSKVTTKNEKNNKDEHRPLVLGVVGLSGDSSRPSFRVGRKMQRLDYKIIPINPKETEILGEKVYKNLAHVAASGIQVDVLVVFRATQHAEQLAKEAIALQKQLGLKCFWLQEGISNDQAADHILQKGHNLEMVMNRCIYKECQRLLGPMMTYLS